MGSASGKMNISAKNEIYQRKAVTYQRKIYFISERLSLISEKSILSANWKFQSIFSSFSAFQFLVGNTLKDFVFTN